MRANNFFTKAVLISFSLLIASIASAQTVTVNVVPVPAASAAHGEVTDIASGTTPFVLLIKATDAKNANYHYSVEATTQDGATKVFKGPVNDFTAVQLGAVDPSTVCVTISSL